MPVGAEVSVPKFVWNGSAQTAGGGCPSASGDRGGAVALLVQCVGSAGIYCQQYAHLYINGADNGMTAACFNTSTTSENIASNWFKHDPISSYQYVLALKGGEMTSVPYARRFERLDRHAHVHEQSLLYGQQRPFVSS